MDEALWALLTGASAVTALCGQRIYWGEAPQGTSLPAVVLTIIGGADQPHLRGTDSLWRYRVQVDCYGLDRARTRPLSRAVVATLNGYSAGATGIRSCFIDGTREDIDDADVKRAARISHDFNIIWRA